MQGDKSSKGPLAPLHTGGSIQPSGCVFERIIREFEDLLEENQSDVYQVKANLRATCDLREYPITCSSCGHSYTSEQDGLRSTKATGLKGAIVEQAGGRIVEQRICRCSRPISIVRSCSRDHSPLGLKCRAQFEIAVNTLVTIAHMEQKDAEELMRVVVQEILQHRCNLALIKQTHFVLQLT
jgi:hypothetical protein